MNYEIVKLRNGGYGIACIKYDISGIEIDYNITEYFSKYAQARHNWQIKIDNLMYNGIV